MEANGNLDDEKLANDVEAVLHTCGSLQRCVEFEYKGQRRLVEPYSLRERNGKVFFFGKCQDKGAIRQFALEEMHDATVTPMPFDPEWPIELGEHVTREEEPSCHP